MKFRHGIVLKCRSAICADEIENNPHHLSYVSMKCRPAICADEMIAKVPNFLDAVSMKCRPAICADHNSLSQSRNLFVSMKCRPAICADFPEPWMLFLGGKQGLNEVPAGDLR